MSHVTTKTEWNALAGRVLLSIGEARRAAKDSRRYLIWLAEEQARLFTEPGWVPVEPPRDGGVLFVHRDRELRVARERGIL